MGRKKKLVVLDDDELVDKENDLLESEIEEEQKKRREIEEWVADFQGQFTDQPVRILIEKLDSGVWSICRKYPLAGFDHELVRDEFGGGEYRATLIDPSGHYVKGGRNRFQFAQAVAKKPAEAGSGNLMEHPLFIMLMKNQEENSRNLMTVMQSIVQSGATQQKGVGLGEIVEAMKGLKEMSPKGEKPMESFRETLQMMKLVKEVTDDGKSDDGGGGILSEIKSFLEIWPTIKEKLPELKAGLPQPVPAAPSATGTPKTGAPPMDPLTNRIVQLIPSFVGAAKTQAPVQTWAEHLLDVMESQIMPVLLPVMKEQYKPLVEDEDDVYDILIKLARDRATRSKIYVQIPPLAPYQVWCDQVIDLAIKDLTEDDSGASVVVEAVSGNGHTDTPA